MFVVGVYSETHPLTDGILSKCQSSTCCNDVCMPAVLQGAAQEGCPTPPPDDLYYNIQWQGSCGGTGSLIAVNGNCQGTCKSARSFVQGTLYVYCSGNPPKWNRGLIDLGPYICLEGESDCCGFQCLLQMLHRLMAGLLLPPLQYCAGDSHKMLYVCNILQPAT